MVLVADTQRAVDNIVAALQEDGVLPITQFLATAR